MDFSEANEPWQAPPRWAAYLINSGFVWAEARPRRRIGIISMPCDSAGAGLVTLGAIRYRLGLADANDALSHFERIEKLAARRDSAVYLRHRSMRGRFRLDGKADRGWVWARQEQSGPGRGSAQSGPARVTIHVGNASEWRLEREAPAETIEGAGIPLGHFYQALVDGADPLLELNLRRSDSAICLAGRVTGESVSRGSFSAVRFRCESQIADLATLLTVHGWLPDTVSRVAFFNSRTQQLDRNSGFTSLVVADGDSAFLRAIDAPEFRESDVVGVIHRAVERDRLELIGTKLTDMSQWYVSDQEMLDRTSAPAGITASVLQRRDV
jgi:hypothetical protein